MKLQVLQVAAQRQKLDMLVGARMRQRLRFDVGFYPIASARDDRVSDTGPPSRASRDVIARSVVCRARVSSVPFDSDAAHIGRR